MQRTVIAGGRAADKLVIEGGPNGTEPRVATILDIEEDGDLVTCLIRWEDNGRELRLLFRESSAGVVLIDR